MNEHNIIVIGASAGGVSALTQLVSTLPADIQATIFIVLHLAPDGTSMLPQILMRHGKLPAFHPKSGDAIEIGKIYVAPNDRHLLIKDGQVLLSSGPKENGFRPSIDALFRTAAATYGSAVIGVILTGMLDNGSAGLVTIKERGGIAIIQDPKDALFPSMPEHALKVVTADYVLPLDQIPGRLVTLLQKDVITMPHNNNSQSDSAETGDLSNIYEHPEGEKTDIICPDCSGVLVKFQSGENGQLLNFRCRVGHRFSLYSLAEKQADTTEAALWAAVRALEESISISQRMQEHARNTKDTLSMKRYAEREREAENHADTIRQILLKTKHPSPQSI